MNNIVINKLSLIILSIALVFGTLYFGTKLLFLLMPFLIALLISKILQPVLFILHKQLRLPKSIATLIAVFSFITLSGYLIYTLGFYLISELALFSQGLPELTATIITQLETFTDNLQAWSSNLPIKINLNTDNAIESIVSTLSGQIGSITGYIVNGAQSIPRLLVTIIVTFVASFFMTKDRTLIKESLQPIYKSKLFDNKIIHIIKNDLFFVFKSYFKAQLILMSLTFLETSIGLTLIGINYSVFIALGISLLDALPVFGTGIVFIPWIIVKLFLGDYTLAFSLTIIYLIATLGRQSLEPKILSSQIGVHPLITLLSLYLGVALFGPIGIILGPLTTISAIAIYKAHFLNLENSELSRDI